MDRHGKDIQAKRTVPWAKPPRGEQGMEGLGSSSWNGGEAPRKSWSLTTWSHAGLGRRTMIFVGITTEDTEINHDFSQHKAKTKA